MLESQIFLRYTQRYLKDRTNIALGLEAARADPEIVDETVRTLDKAVELLNDFAYQPEEMVSSQVGFLPNSILVRQALEGRHLPKLLSSPDDFNSDHQGRCRDCFLKAAHLMDKGEMGETQGAWQFHIDLNDLPKLSDALGSELYGLYASKLFPNLDPHTIVASLEEMIAVHLPESRMFHSVSEWITEEEGFSHILVGMVNGRVLVPFQKGQVIRQTPNFRVVDGYKQGLEGQVDGQRFIIEPLTSIAEGMLQKASRRHKIYPNQTPRGLIDKFGHLVEMVTLRADRVGDNLRVLLGGFIEEPKNSKDSIPSLDRMEECLRDHSDYYSFSDDLKRH